MPHSIPILNSLLLLLSKWMDNGYQKLRKTDWIFSMATFKRNFAYLLHSLIHIYTRTFFVIFFSFFCFIYFFSLLLTVSILLSGAVLCVVNITLLWNEKKIHSFWCLKFWVLWARQVCWAWLMLDDSKETQSNAYLMDNIRGRRASRRVCYFECTRHSFMWPRVI